MRIGLGPRTGTGDGEAIDRETMPISRNFACMFDYLDGFTARKTRDEARRIGELSNCHGKKGEVCGPSADNRMH